MKPETMAMCILFIATCVASYGWMAESNRLRECLTNLPPVVRADLTNWKVKP